MSTRQFIWVFNGARAAFPSGVFTSQAHAEAWIQQHGLSGILTKYPLNIGVYDFAIEQEWFLAKTPEQQSSDFIARFSSAHQEHIHYEAGDSN
jgi:hypothetical protein